MSYLTHKRIYYIDSHNRIGGNNSNFTYQIQIPRDMGFDRVVLLTAVIPKSYYLIADGLNTMTLQEDGSNITITFPPGNYSASSFAAVCTNLLTTASVSGITYTVKYPNIATSANTGRFLFTASTGNPSLIFGDALYEQFGFDDNSTNAFVVSSLTSKNVIKFQVKDTLLLHSDICTNGQDDILNEIFVAASPDFSNIKYDCIDVQAYSKTLSTQNQNTYRFSLTDEDGNNLDLNGLNMVLTICIYKNDDTIRNYIKYKLLQDTPINTSAV